MYLFVNYLVNWFQYFSPCSVAVVAVAKVLAGIEKHTHPHMHALAVSQKRDWTTQSAHRAPFTPFGTTKQTPPSPPHCRWAPKCVAYSASARFFFARFVWLGLGFSPTVVLTLVLVVVFVVVAAVVHIVTQATTTTATTRNSAKKVEKTLPR